MRRLVIAIAVVVALVAGAWFVLAGGPGGILGPGGATPTPTLGPVAPATRVVAEARAVPGRTAELAIGVPGRVVEVAPEGAAVAAGAILLRLDTSAADADVSGAEAAVAAAQAGLARATALQRQAEEGVKAADETVDQAHEAWNAARATRDLLPSSAPDAQERAAEAEAAAAGHAFRAAQAQSRAARRAAEAAAAGVSVAEADLARAQAGLAGATAARDELTIRAPFAGSVAAVGPAVGERVAPGVVLVRLADSSAWRFETTDLDETGVARLAVGDAAEITVDAFPGVQIPGRVASIGSFGTDRQGDIVYRVVVEPVGPVPAGLRWGMTAAVSIEPAP